MLLSPRTERPKALRLNDYTIHRIAPSMLIHYGMKALEIKPGGQNILRAFILLNLITLTLGVFLFCLAAVTEGGLIFLTKNPDKHLGPLARLYRNYYFKYEWKVIQLLPECAQYNDRLAYTLKSGECQLSEEASRPFAEFAQPLGRSGAPPLPLVGNLAFVGVVRCSNA